MTLTQQQDIQEFNRNVKKLIQILSKSDLPKPKEWGTHEDACKILDRSKEWYRLQRKANLVEGKDWRSDGKQIEYKLESIERLKRELISDNMPLD